MDVPWPSGARKLVEHLTNICIDRKARGLPVRRHNKEVQWLTDCVLLDMPTNNVVHDTGHASAVPIWNKLLNRPLYLEKYLKLVDFILNENGLAILICPTKNYSEIEGAAKNVNMVVFRDFPLLNTVALPSNDRNFEVTDMYHMYS